MGAPSSIVEGGVKLDPAVARVRSAVRRSLAEVDAGSLVLVAVSGGADSLALAAATAWVAPKLGLRAGAVIVDHGLQAGSAEVAARAAATCRTLGLDPVVVETVIVDGAGGPEAAARTARYAALDAAAHRLGAGVVLLGHTLDDQAETVLLRLARGSGARSLAAMSPESNLYRRPLLGIRRTETRQACTWHRLEVWDDLHNADQRFARVRVRSTALPALEQALGPGVAEALARSAELLRDDADALDAWAEKAGTDGLLASELSPLPSAVRRRVLRAAALAAGASPGRLSARHLTEIDRLVTDWHGQGPVSLPGGLVAVRRYDRLSFQ
jgi:tRNA(Ile)-lysidine synthase